MTKTIIKEAGIVILLILVVALVLAILFYDYIPNNKTVPINLKAYSMPEDVKQELGNTILDQQNIVRTYYIDSSDLDMYESTNDYDKGKANPFADYTNNANVINSSTNSVVNNSTGNATSKTTNNAENTNSISQETGAKQNEVYINTPGKN